MTSSTCSLQEIFLERTSSIGTHAASLASSFALGSLLKYSHSTAAKRKWNVTKPDPSLIMTSTFVRYHKGRPMTLVSSFSSRAAAERAVSPRSTCPPGKPQRPASGLFFRLTSRTWSARTITAKAATFGAFVTSVGLSAHDSDE
jgi:hypothetical protein